MISLGHQNASKSKNGRRLYGDLTVIWIRKWRMVVWTAHVARLAYKLAQTFSRKICRGRPPGSSSLRLDDDIETNP